MKIAVKIAVSNRHQKFSSQFHLTANVHICSEICSCRLFAAANHSKVCLSGYFCRKGHSSPRGAPERGAVTRDKKIRKNGNSRRALRNKMFQRRVVLYRSRKSEKHVAGPAGTLLTVFAFKKEDFIAPVGTEFGPKGHQNKTKISSEDNFIADLRQNRKKKGEKSKGGAPPSGRKIRPWGYINVGEKEIYRTILKGHLQYSKRTEIFRIFLKDIKIKHLTREYTPLFPNLRVYKIRKDRVGCPWRFAAPGRHGNREHSRKIQGTIRKYSENFQIKFISANLSDPNALRNYEITRTNRDRAAAATEAPLPNRKGARDKVPPIHTQAYPCSKIFLEKSYRIFSNPGDSNKPPLPSFSFTYSEIHNLEKFRNFPGNTNFIDHSKLSNKAISLTNRNSALTALTNRESPQYKLLEYFCRIFSTPEEFKKTYLPPFSFKIRIILMHT
jgi:hypothetical protein